MYYTTKTNFGQFSGINFLDNLILIDEHPSGGLTTPGELYRMLQVDGILHFAAVLYTAGLNNTTNKHAVIVCNNSITVFDRGVHIDDPGLS